MYSFLETPALVAEKAFDNKQGNALSFFITIENFEKIRNFLIKGRELKNENYAAKYYRIFSPAKDIICRFKQKSDDDTDINTDVVFMKIMREQSTKGNNYLKVDFCNTYGAKAKHEIIFKKTGDEDLEGFIFKSAWVCTKCFVRNKVEIKQKRARRRN